MCLVVSVCGIGEGWLTSLSLCLKLWERKSFGMGPKWLEQARITWLVEGWTNLYYLYYEIDLVCFNIRMLTGTWMCPSDRLWHVLESLIKRCPCTQDKMRTVIVRQVLCRLVLYVITLTMIEATSIPLPQIRLWLQSIRHEWTWWLLHTSNSFGCIPNSWAVELVLSGSGFFIRPSRQRWKAVESIQGLRLQ